MSYSDKTPVHWKGMGKAVGTHLCRLFWVCQGEEKLNLWYLVKRAPEKGQMKQLVLTHAFEEWFECNAEVSDL